jgi:hypothetical protein
VAKSPARALATESVLPHERPKGVKVDGAEHWVANTDIEHEDSAGLDVHVLFEVPHYPARFGRPFGRPGMFKAWKSFSSVSSALAVISALRP